MSRVRFDYSKASGFVSEGEIKNMQKLAEAAKETLVSKSGAGNDFLGWIDLPVDYDKEEFARIKKAAKKIQEDSEVLVVIGIEDLIWVQEQRLNFYVTASTIGFKRSPQDTGNLLCRKQHQRHISETPD